MTWLSIIISGIVTYFSRMAMVALIDRVRMLDNDMIRLNTKLSMVLEYYQQKGMQPDKDLEAIVNKYMSQSESFDSTGKKK